MASSVSGGDPRASTSTNGDDPANTAPEVDHAVQAPQCGRDRAGPEVAPGREAQVYYNNSPPEAIVSSYLQNVSDVNLGKDAPSARSTRKILVVAMIAAFILTATALGVGLGVGLRQKEKSASSLASTDFASTITRTSTIAQATATPEALQHGIQTNTSLAAVTLRTGDRHIYF
ncbi:MAG: hypothetical protein Q9226_001889 [Calogaya cf. arnoldii]